MCTAHAMVQMMIKCTALETAYHGVRINGVASGVIKSNARTKNDPMEMALNDAENKQFLVEASKDVPLQGQLNDPRDVANSLLFLASDDASFITGEIMTVDGGQSLTTDSYEDYMAMLQSVYLE